MAQKRDCFGIGLAKFVWFHNNSTTYNPAGASTVSLGSAANIYGNFNNGSAITNGGLVNAGYAYSANLPGTNLTFNGVSYSLGTAGLASDASLDTLALPAGSDQTLSFPGTGVVGNQPAQAFVITYTDNTTATFMQGLSDWGSQQPRQTQSGRRPAADTLGAVRPLLTAAVILRFCSDLRRPRESSTPQLPDRPLPCALSAHPG